MPDNHELDMWDVNKWLKDTLSGLALPLSEEPMLQKADGSDYITWQQTSKTNNFASGRIVRQSARVTLMLWALEGSSWQLTQQSIINLLTAAGAASAKPGPEAWLPDLGRRQVYVYVLLRRQV